MVSFNDILQWSGNSLADAGNALIAASHKYEFASQELTDLRIDNFKGESAKAEDKKRRILADDAEDLWKQITDAGRDLIDVADTADHMRESAYALISEAAGDNISIRDGKAVGHGPSTSSETEEKYQHKVDNLVGQANDTIQFIERTCRHIINLKNTALAPRNEVIDHGISEAPDASWTPEDVNDWWTSLSPEEQQSVIDNHPEWIGNLNGIPMKARDQSNRKRLSEMAKKIDQQVRDFEPKTESDGYGVSQNAEYRALLDKQKEIHALERSINSDDSKNVGRTLLVLDDSPSDHLRAAVGSGDVDHADHVVTHTPGMGSKVSTTLATEDGSRGSGVAEVENVLDESGRSWRANDTNHTGETVAGVTWLGYDAPPNPTDSANFDVAYSYGAAEAGRDLANFQEGLQATHQGDPHLVSMDHSYGSLVGGYAGQLTDAVDDHIVAGSPGLRSYADSGFDIHGTTDASDLNALPGTLYAADANRDWVPASNLHGDNPANSGTFIKSYDTDFVALETGEEDGLKGVTGHEHYFERGSTPAHDMGKILVHEKPEHIADSSLNQPVNKRPWPK